MVTELLDKLLNLGETWERLDKASTQKILDEFEILPNESEQSCDQEQHGGLEALLAELRANIQDGTVTIAQIDSSIKSFPNISLDLQEFLIVKKADIYSLKGDKRQSLVHLDEALTLKETPATWAMKAITLLQLGQIFDAFEAFHKSYALKEYFGPLINDYLRDMFWAWSTSASLYGLDGVLLGDVAKLQKGVEEFLYVDEKAKTEGLEDSLGKLVYREPTEEQPENSLVRTSNELIIYKHESAELRNALEELGLAVRLLSIKDPFEGWRELGKEISKVWPEGLSAVDAVREQRDREWNT